MITIQRTVDIPPDGRLVLKLPKTTPRGRVRVVLTLDTPAGAAAEPAPAAENTAARLLNHQFPTIEELKAEAARKAAEREAYFKATGKDPLQQFCGCLKGVFDEDGVTIQRKMRDEWPD